jgi:predicted Fe-Mo cluster-binding NifX family protein
MKLIAIASDDDKGLDGMVSAHFGRCPYVTLVEVDGDQIVKHWVERNPNSELHQPGTMPLFIQALGASVIIAGGMGPRAVAMFRSRGIEVTTGPPGPVREVLESFLQGRMKGVVPCEHAGDDGCGAHGAGHAHHGHDHEHERPTTQSKVVAVSTQSDSGLAAVMDPRFGRAPFYTLVDLQSGEVISTLPNAAREEAHGAGTTAARIISDSGARAVIAGRFGPKAEQALVMLGIELWTAPDGLTAKQAIERLKAGELTRAGGG